MALIDSSGFAHVRLTVTDIRQSKAFYDQVFGWPVAADAPPPVPDPKTGEIKPAKLITKTYRLEGNICRRLLPPNTPAPEEAHPIPEPKKEKKAKGKRK